MIKKIFIGLVAVLAIVLIWQRELVSYGIMQAKGQIKVLWNARPIDELLADPQVADSLKQKVQLVQEVKQFAIDSLGVNNSGSYGSVYDQKGKPILWVITATEPFSLEDRKWKFPLLGTFSYKGFFDYQKALLEKEELANQGLDTGIRTVSAWSTLGFFDDPILSQLLFRTEGRVANTIIHELTHGTIFVKDNLQLNENIASLIGDQGALVFLSHKYGAESVEVQEYARYLEDRRTYTNHMLRGTKQLDSLYRSFSEDLPKEAKLSKKEMLIQKIVATTDTLNLITSQYQKVRDKLKTSDKLPNNTFFKSYVRYRRNIDDLKNELTEQFSGDISQYLAYLQEKYD
ncbi:aminopeptidase [Tunicatimonas pelagia]|uniref:aminopeptidase n=1 Tax=Tunicatimonas pelagia TaxID=931531 RepID=UPI002665FDAB|nr:aminopeptidase [Tunicatimonas pelagia]WKN44306.1 aminopeptidase [Tunicatimonas pelagia]